MSKRAGVAPERRRLSDRTIAIFPSLFRTRTSCSGRLGRDTLFAAFRIKSSAPFPPFFTVKSQANGSLRLLLAMLM